MEEAGVKVIKVLFDPYKDFFESSYTNARTGKLKTTTVWAAQIPGDAQVTIQPEEIMSYRYVDIEHAHEILSFKEDRQTMEQLRKLLENTGVLE